MGPSFKPDKTCPDGIFPKFLQAEIDVIIGPLIQMFRSNYALVYIPKAWRTARVTFKPKQGQVNYTQAKSFRPMNFTSSMLNTMENILTCTPKI